MPAIPVLREPIPRRGYCFRATVEFSDALEVIGPKPADVDEKPKSPASVLLAEGHSPWHLRETTALAWRVVPLVLAGMVVGALLFLAWVSYSRSHRPLS